MSEWWTYTLSDFLLFSPRTYYRLFELYNAEIWPGQVLGLLTGLAILALARNPGPWQSRVISALLGAYWLWVAWAYHYARYASINWAATYFAMAFAVEALLLIVIALAGRGLVVRGVSHWINWVGVGLVVFALAAQPLIGPLAGRPWSQVEIFGIAPDPTVVATLGVLVLACGWPKLLLPIPILWCLVSGATAWAMQSSDAALMPAVAILVVFAGTLSALVRWVHLRADDR